MKNRKLKDISSRTEHYYIGHLKIKTPFLQTYIHTYLQYILHLRDRGRNNVGAKENGRPIIHHQNRVITVIFLSAYIGTVQRNRWVIQTFHWQHTEHMEVCMLVGWLNNLFHLSVYCTACILNNASHCQALSERAILTRGGHFWYPTL